MHELRRHSDRLPIPSEDRERCLAAAEHMYALNSIMAGDPVDGCLIANLPDPVRVALLRACGDDCDAARGYVFEAVSMALRLGLEPADLGLTPAV